MIVYFLISLDMVIPTLTDFQLVVKFFEENIGKPQASEKPECLPSVGGLVSIFTKHGEMQIET
jgi:hypothetical protein